MIRRETGGRGLLRKDPLFSDHSRQAETSRNSGLADGVGFEPTRSVNPCRFSRPVPSTARPPIQTLNIASVFLEKLSSFKALLPDLLPNVLQPTHSTIAKRRVDPGRGIFLHRLRDVAV
jgi:hypothetical protein